MSHPSRPAFSRIELVVVVGLILALVGFLAVQGRRVREAANRTADL